jgi:hypothetical protein
MDDTNRLFSPEKDLDPTPELVGAAEGALISALCQCLHDTGKPCGTCLNKRREFADLNRQLDRYDKFGVSFGHPALKFESAHRRLPHYPDAFVVAPL